MTEQDYIAATALSRVIAAEDVLRCIAPLPDSLAREDRCYHEALDRVRKDLYGLHEALFVAARVTEKGPPK